MTPSTVVAVKLSSTHAAISLEADEPPFWPPNPPGRPRIVNAQVQHRKNPGSAVTLEA